VSENPEAGWERSRRNGAWQAARQGHSGSDGGSRARPRRRRGRGQSPVGQAPHPFRQGRVWAPGQLGPAAHDDPEDGVWSELMLELAEQVFDDVGDGAVVHGAGSGVCSDHRLGCPSRTGPWFRRGVGTRVGWLRAEWVERVEHERHGWLPRGGHQGSGPQRRLRRTRRERRSPCRGGCCPASSDYPPLRPSHRYPLCRCNGRADADSTPVPEGRLYRRGVSMTSSRAAWSKAIVRRVPSWEPLARSHWPSHDGRLRRDHHADTGEPELHHLRGPDPMITQRPHPGRAPCQPSPTAELTCACHGAPPHNPGPRASGDTLCQPRRRPAGGLPHLWLYGRPPQPQPTFTCDRGLEAPCPNPHTV